MIPLKETLEVGEAPVSQGTNRPKPDSGQLRSDAVSLDVPVKVHGSRVVEVVRGTTPHTEPFEEQTSTMIVFPLGGVLKMTTPVNVGQAIVLTNLKTHQDAICRVVKTRTNPNLHSYVEVEFSHPQPGYWGVHFSSDGPEPPKKADSPTASASAAPAPITLAPAAAVISAPGPKVEIPRAATPKIETPKIETKGQKAVPAAPAASVRAPAPASVTSVETSMPAARTDSASFSLDQLRADTGAAYAAPLSNTDRVEVAETQGSLVADEPPAAHETSTFGRFASSAAPGAERGAARPAFGAGLDYSPLEAAAEKDQSQGKNWVLIGVCVGALLAAAGGGGFHFLHKRPAAQPVAVTAPAAPESPIAADASSNPIAATPAPVQQTRAGVTPSATDVSRPLDKPPVAARARQAEPDRTTKAMPSEPAQSPSESPSQSKVSESAKQKSTTAVPDMFGALNAHPTTAVHSSTGDSGAAPSIETGALAGGQGIALPSSEPAPANLAPPPPPPQPASEGPVTVGGDVKAPRAISSAAPAYPEIARQAGVEGNVVVRIVIDKAGNVTEAKALSGPMLLRDAAVSALRQRKYAPSKLDGHPISVEMLVTIQFRR
jgi:protein TonB